MALTILKLDGLALMSSYTSSASMRYWDLSEPVEEENCIAYWTILNLVKALLSIILSMCLCARCKIYLLIFVSD